MDYQADMLRIVLEYAKAKNWNETELANEIGATPSQLSNWKRRGGMSNEAILPALDRLGIRISPWIRKELKLDEGNVTPGPAIRDRVPLISWVQAGNWNDVADPYSVGDAEDWLPCIVSHGPRTYCLRVRGQSMYNPTGRRSYAEGAIIFVDPDRHAQHADCVIVRLEDERESTFKQYLEEGDDRYLKALNPAWPDPIIKVKSDATICGVVIGQWMP
jgi:SOS-response transcriptional repressor LexA